MSEGTGASNAVSVGDWAKRVSDDRAGRVAAIFETPWDTANQGADHTRTVARLEYGSGLFEHVFLDQLVMAAVHFVRHQKTLCGLAKVAAVDGATLRPADVTCEKCLAALKAQGIVSHE